MEEKRNEESTMAAIRGLEVGRSAAFPIERVLSVRSMCTMLATQLSRRYRANADREAGTVTVTRLETEEERKRREELEDACLLEQARYELEAREAAGEAL